jgi:hypothetical protein
MANGGLHDNNGAKAVNGEHHENGGAHDGNGTKAHNGANGTKTDNAGSEVSPAGEVASTAPTS